MRGTANHSMSVRGGIGGETVSSENNVRKQSAAIIGQHGGGERRRNGDDLGEGLGGGHANLVGERRERGECGRCVPLKGCCVGELNVRENVNVDELRWRKHGRET